MKSLCSIFWYREFAINNKKYIFGKLDFENIKKTLANAFCRQFTLEELKYERLWKILFLHALFCMSFENFPGTFLSFSKKWWDYAGVCTLLNRKGKFQPKNKVSTLRKYFAIVSKPISNIWTLFKAKKFFREKFYLKFNTSETLYRLDLIGRGV